MAQSSTEAEYIAASEATKEIIWATTFLTELGVKHLKPTLLIDNQSTIHLIKNHDVKRRSKHIETKYHLVRQNYAQGVFELAHVGSKEQLADPLTKPVHGDQLRRLSTLSNVIKSPTESSVGGDRGGVLESAITSMRNRLLFCG